MCSLLYKDRVRVLVCWFIVHYSWAHNFREILCRVSAVHLSRRRDAVPRNACNFQRLVVLVCVQLQSTFFSFWNELESLFNCIFHFNYIHTVPNNICLFKLYKASRIKDHSLSQASQDSGYPNRPRSLGVAEAKATKTIIIITGSFFLCFAPTLCVSLVHQLAYVREDVILHVVYPLAESALFVTALVNPVIYVWRNALVKESLKELFKAH